MGFLTCELDLCQQNSGRSRTGDQGKVFKHKERNEQVLWLAPCGAEVAVPALWEGRQRNQAW